MFESTFFFTFFTAVSAVIIISILFEKVKPKIAGVLSGYPVATAITLFFFGFNNGAEFASNSAIFNIAGTTTFLTFLYVYYRVSRIFNKWVIAASTISAITGYLVVAYILQMISFNLFSACILSTLAILIFTLLFNNIREIKTGNKINPTRKSLLLRAVLTGSIIVTVTSVAKFIGPGWAGLLSAFPSTVLPLMLIVHYKYTTMHVHALLKHIPRGSFSLLLYSSAVFYAYPIFGIYLGTMIAYMAASVFIVLMYFLQNKQFISKIKEIIGMADKSKTHFILTGGSIDFHYDRRLNAVVPNEKSAIPEFIKSMEYVKADFTEICIKDSRKLTKRDFKKVLGVIEKSPYEKIIITVGIYRMDKMVEYLKDNLKRNDQTIVVTGSSTPLMGFSPSEGPFNLGHALAIVQHLPNGIYISYNGDLFSGKEIKSLIKEGGLASIFMATQEAPLY